MELSLRRFRIGLDDPPKYFHRGHSTPCSLYLGKTEMFQAGACAVILFTLNFSFAADNSPRPEFHSKLDMDQLIDNSSIQMWQDQGIAISSYGMLMDDFGFIVLYDKNDILKKQAKLNGILSPFPVVGV